MAYYLLEIENHLLSDASDERVRFDVEEGVEPIRLWPWLDPVWGFVEKVWEGFESRDLSAKAAELLVRAPEGLASILPLTGALIRYERPRGQIFIDKRGCLHHVTCKKKTALSGEFSHDTFAFGLPRVDDLDEFLRERAVAYIEERIGPTLRFLQTDPDPAFLEEAILKSLWRLDLATAEYSDLDESVDTSLTFLTHPQSKELSR